MKRKLKAPPKPTKEEAESLKKYLWMDNWHFEETIKKKCTEISSYSIYWHKSENNYHWVYATVFGLRGIRIQTNEPCIANLFIRYKTRVYQMAGILNAAGIIQLLKKEAEFEEYKEKLRDQQWKERKKVIAAKQKEKAKVKKLRVVAKEKAA